jgi:hypothetical protein
VRALSPVKVAVSAYDSPAICSANRRRWRGGSAATRARRNPRVEQSVQARPRVRDTVGPNDCAGRDGCVEPSVAALDARQPVRLVDRDRPQPPEHTVAIGLAAQQDQPRGLAGVLDQRARRVHRTPDRPHERAVVTLIQLGFVATRHRGCGGLGHGGLLAVGGCLRPEPAAETGPASPTHASSVNHRSTPDRLGRQSGPSTQRPTDDQSRWTGGHRAVVLPLMRRTAAKLALTALAVAGYEGGRATDAPPAPVNPAARSQLSPPPSRTRCRPLADDDPHRAIELTWATTCRRRGHRRARRQRHRSPEMTLV